jgi:TonB-dependent SusC/RagA subfamily outer membrane receptor
MHFTRTCLATLVGLGTVLFCGQAQAQSADSTSESKSRIMAAKADSASLPHNPIRIRCTSSIAAGKSPLFVIDGKVLAEQNIKSVNLNPTDIDKIDVLKGTAATAIYGSSAINGVILITTKQRVSKYILRPEAKKDHLS